MNALSPMSKRFTILNVLILLVFVFPGLCCSAQDLPEWTQQLRADHPRLFFNAQTWPDVRKRALGAERKWYLSIKAHVDRLHQSEGQADRLETKDYGQQAAGSAFVYRMTQKAKYLELTRKCLDASLRFYDQCYDQKKSVNWYSTSRVHATLAWDWIYEDLSPAQRRDFMSRLVRAIDRVLQAKPAIYRENMSGYQTGFYGVKNCLWFIGCTAFGTGIESEKVNAWLVWGRNENMRLLEHRRRACGDDGGGASATLGYVVGMYPWSENNFFYTWLSATGENIAPNWPHSAMLANYVIWNWIEAEDGPLEFGYGDRPSTHNALPTNQLYTHMANIQYLHSQQYPKEAALAAHLQKRLSQKRYSGNWFIYPFLWTDKRSTLDPFAPESLPLARHFESMGQIFLRSGMGSDDTYCLFSCGGILDQHRHYDALNFVIYHRGFLALDSGTRYKESDNGQHLANYYAQTVAHNCVVVHQPDEPPIRYWGGTITGNHGGQHKQLGSVVKAFETNDDFVYVAGDATASYLHGPVQRPGKPDLPEKVDLVTRQIVFLPPHHFVIFDRVVSTDPGYEKNWLIHTALEPQIHNQTIRADHRQGRMVVQTLLPQDAVLKAVGGPGKEFWAAGKNWDIVKDGLNQENLALMGQWRVEVTPAKARKQDLFLHVIQVGDENLVHPSKAELIKAEAVVGVQFNVAETQWEVLFSTEGPLAGHIKRQGQGRKLDRPLTMNVQRQVGIAARDSGQ